MGDGELGVSCVGQQGDHSASDGGMNEPVMRGFDWGVLP